MKLAIVVSQFPCSDEVFILREMRALDHRGFDLQIYSLRAPSEAPLHADAAPLVKFARYSPFLLSSSVLRRNLELLVREPALYGRLLARIFLETWQSKPFLWRSLVLFPEAVRWGMELRDEPVERIHAHWATHPSTAAWIMSQISKIPLSMTAHAHDIYLDQSMLAFKLRAAVVVLTCTRQNVETLRGLVPELPDGHIRLSYHGLDLETYKPAAIPPDVFRILSVGTLLPRKGFDTLLDACAILERDGVEHECCIVGDGPMRDSLERQATRLGLKSVRFLGKQSQERLPDIYRRSSVFVLAAVHSETTASVGTGPNASALIHFGIPNAILEAMASGLPVVATRLTALGEVLEDGQTGLYVPERDAAATAAALKSLAASAPTRSRLGALALERVRAGFDIHVTIGGVADALGTPTGARPGVAAYSNSAR